MPVGGGRQTTLHPGRYRGRSSGDDGESSESGDEAPSCYVCKRALDQDELGPYADRIRLMSMDLRWNDDAMLAAAQRQGRCPACRGQHPSDDSGEVDEDDDMPPSSRRSW